MDLGVIAAENKHLDLRPPGWHRQQRSGEYSHSWITFDDVLTGLCSG